MRYWLIIPFVFVFTSLYSISRTDSTKSKLNFNGNFSFNSNGMASIPAFSLGKPALIASLTLQKKRFSYDPVVAYGLNLRPWVIDNWIHYRLIYNPKFELRTGVDISTFFSDIDSTDYKILQGQQYITLEIAAVFRFSPKHALSVMYWSDNGQDHGTMKGDFYSIVYDLTNLGIGKSMLFTSSIQFFYIDYDGKNDGFFFAPKLSVTKKGVPVTLFYQVTQAITSNIDPFPGFKCNAGIGYLF
jgi:hypothetical protein